MEKCDMHIARIYMKILAISDTHKKTDKAVRICRALHDIDLVVHLGDHERDAAEIAKAVGTDVISVKGNCDGSCSYDDCKIIESPYGKLLLTHGHMQNVKQSLQNLIYLAQENDCKAALFGHTHRPCIEEVNGLYLINPGSLTLPADGGNGSYAVVYADKDEFSASIVYYDVIEELISGEEPKKPKVTSGFLRNILNYSDRL